VLSLPAELSILLLLVLANGLIAMAETALFAARKARLRRMAEEGEARAARALALAEEPARFLAVVRFWLTLSAMIAGVLAGAELAGQLARGLARLPALASSARALSFILLTLGLSGFMVLFGELAPRRAGRAYRRK